MNKLLVSLIICILPTLSFASDLAHPVSGYDEQGNCLSGFAYSNEWHSGVRDEIADAVFLRTYDGYASGATTVQYGFYYSYSYR